MPATDFLTTNISSIFNNKVQDDSTAADEFTATLSDDGTVDNKENTQKQSRPNDFDWGAELKKRLETNKNMSPESRESEYNIETKFFKEYFSEVFQDATLVKELMLMGDPLRKALRVIGFNKNINPILGFISNKYVQKTLIMTKLLNSNTFKAIYNAVAKKLIADSEFFTSNTYNIIYCADLYKKSLTEIMEYIELQSKILEVSAKKYTVEKQLENRKVFLFINKIKELDNLKRADLIKNMAATEAVPSVKTAATKLNNIELAKVLLKKLSGKDFGNNKGKSHLGSKEQQNLVNKLNTPAKALAAMQYLSVSTDSSVAQSALADKRFSDVSAKELINATIGIKSILPKGQLKKSDADALADLLLSTL